VSGFPIWTAQGGCGSLLLHRVGLAPITPCRSLQRDANDSARHSTPREIIRLTTRRRYLVLELPEATPVCCPEYRRHGRCRTWRNGPARRQRHQLTALACFRLRRLFRRCFLITPSTNHSAPTGSMNPARTSPKNLIAEAGFVTETGSS
jgi:hypothetical protein